MSDNDQTNDDDARSKQESEQDERELKKKSDALPSRPSDTDPSAAEPPQEPVSPSKPYQNLGVALAAGIFLIVILVVATGSAHTLQENISQYISSFGERSNPVTMLGDGDDGLGTEDDSTFMLANLPNHPNRVFEPYLTGPIVTDANPESAAPLVSEFRALIDLFVKRQAVDDNFTIRVFDSRSGELLELYELEEARAEYQRSGEADWLGEVDQQRRVATRRLVDKYVAEGIPRDPIIVKWGRANQVELAQKRNEAFIEHQVRLTEYLDMSLLPTQISMVETFNHDKWVSSAGARSRFQMMPWNLQQGDIHRYSLPLEGGGSVSVREEWNPLITMIPAFKLMRAYTNAVGHEIPGLSAYHTGPGNIYKVYRYFLTRASDRYVSDNPTVMDAYMWATTAGYPIMEANTSFGPFSRGYVVSAYGALAAVDEEPLDTTKTMLTERLQLRDGEEVSLASLLGTLDENREMLTVPDGQSLYETFRSQNEHIPLPEADDDSIPDGGNVVLSASAGGEPVRFFLPLGATNALRASGRDILNPAATIRFDHSVFSDEDVDITQWDREYRTFVEETMNFGFTTERRARLRELMSTFEQLAQENPTRFRRWQADIINVHNRLWSTDAWDAMAGEVRSSGVIG